ncbi:MAG: SGNH/GDSL hydrolase family protein [Cyclobacteriaceae bacterium]
MNHSISKYNLLMFLLIVLSQCGEVSAQENDNKEDQKEGLHADGGTWGFKPGSDIGENDSVCVLLIGDSILKGYGSLVKDSLKSATNVDMWVTGKHLNSDGLIEELQEYVSRRKYAVIHFNIGLHGWQDGRIPEGQYVPLLERYVHALKKYAPQAKLIWASTTPVTEQGVAELNKEINPTIIERNALAAEVMKRNDIVVNDLYSIVVGRLDLARLDRFHWNADAYQMMSSQISNAITDEIEK